MKHEALKPGEQEAMKAKMAEYAKQFPVPPKKDEQLRNG